MPTRNTNDNVALFIWKKHENNDKIIVGDENERS